MRTMVDLVCPMCGKNYKKVKYEHERNQTKGRVSVCSRPCLAKFMNLSPAKQAQTKAMLAERNAHQWREDNPNWKGGISDRLKPVPSKEAK